MTIGFLGAGTMTAAIVTGLRAANVHDGVVLSPRNPASAAALASRFAGVSVASSNQELLDQCDLLILAVRPQIAAAVLSDLRFHSRHRVISIVSGINVRQIADLVAPANAIVRAVPLPSAAKRRSPTAIFPRDTTALNLFSSLGTAFEVDRETEFEALCAVTGTIASQLTFADIIATWLVRQGVAELTARRYVEQMLAGIWGETETVSAADFRALAAEHATPGGINERVLHHLVEQGAFTSVTQGLEIVMRRYGGNIS